MESGADEHPDAKLFEGVLRVRNTFFEIVPAEDCDDCPPSQPLGKACTAPATVSTELVGVPLYRMKTAEWYEKGQDWESTADSPQLRVSPEALDDQELMKEIEACEGEATPIVEQSQPMLISDKVIQSPHGVKWADMCDGGDESALKAAPEGGGGYAEEPKPEAPRVLTGSVWTRQLERTSSASTPGKFRFGWTVDAKRMMMSNDTRAVSPAMLVDLPGGISGSFNVMILPVRKHLTKGGASFKKAGGAGTLLLKCQDVIPRDHAGMAYRLCIGSGELQSDWSDPVLHNFYDRPTSSLPEGKDEWDFSKVIDEASQSFVICLEIVPRPGI